MLSLWLCVQNEGRLEGNGESINWIGRAGDKTSSLPFKNIKAVAFYDFGRSCQLWLTDASGSLHRFDGFRNGDFDRLAAYLSGHGLTLARRELSTKGRNWGSVRLNGGRLELLDDGGKVVAPIPLAQVSQAAMPGKNELEIQFFDDDTGACVACVAWREASRSNKLMKLQPCNLFACIPFPRCLIVQWSARTRAASSCACTYPRSTHCRGWT